VGIPLKYNKVFGQLLLMAMLFKALLPTLAIAQTVELDPENSGLSNIVICTATGIKVVSFNPETGEYDEQNAPAGNVHDCQMCQVLHQVALEAGLAAPFKYDANSIVFATPSRSMRYFSTAPPTRDSAPRAPPLSLL